MVKMKTDTFAPASYDPNKASWSNAFTPSIEGVSIDWICSCVNDLSAYKYCPNCFGHGFMPIPLTEINWKIK
jgi:hypothetical protein